MKLHHVGMVVRNIEESSKVFAEALGGRLQSAAVDDPIQQVKVEFWTIPGSESTLEFIQPLTETSPAAQLMKKGGGLAHLCFEVDDIEASVRNAQACGALVIQQPVPATAFDGRRIAFIYYRNLGVMELVEGEGVAR